MATLLTALLALGFPTAVVAQARPSVQSQADEPSAQSKGALFSPEHRQELYDNSKLSYSKAALYTLLFPGLGNIYVEQYFAAGISFMLMLFAIVFAGYGLQTDQPSFVWWGVGTAGVAYVGGGALSLYGVQQYNMELRRSLKIGDGEASLNSPGIHITFRF